MIVFFIFWDWTILSISLFLYIYVWKMFMGMIFSSFHSSLYCEHSCVHLSDSSFFLFILIFNNAGDFPIATTIFNGWSQQDMRCWEVFQKRIYPVLLQVINYISIIYIQNFIFILLQQVLTGILKWRIKSSLIGQIIQTPILEASGQWFNWVWNVFHSNFFLMTNSCDLSCKIQVHSFSIKINRSGSSQCNELHFWAAICMASVDDHFGLKLEPFTHLYKLFRCSCGIFSHLIRGLLG